MCYANCDRCWQFPMTRESVIITSFQLVWMLRRRSHPIDKKQRSEVLANESDFTCTCHCEK